MATKMYRCNSFERCGAAAGRAPVRKQGRSTRQNASPIFVVQCHGAWTRLVLAEAVGSAFCSDALAPPSLFALPALQADAADLAEMPSAGHIPR
jgi:hypothetical protein